MIASTWDTATACPPHAIERALASIDDLLRVHKRPDDPRRILQAVADELREARRWRVDNMAGADEAIQRHEAELQSTAEAAEALEAARACIRFYGASWRHALPATAWRSRRLVHLDIIEAESDPAALAGALERHYGPERAQVAA